MNAIRGVSTARLSRRILVGGIAAVAISTSVGTSEARSPSPRRPFPQRPRYAEHTIFPSRPWAELTDDVRAAYDRWKDSYLVSAGSNDAGMPMHRVAFGTPGTEEHAVTVSEGQGYGMLIVAHLAGHDPDAHALFDGLWRFARANPSRNDARLMNWHVPPLEDIDSAFDGDADIAYGLLLADAQWGSDGEIDYRSAARSVIDGILESTIGPDSRLPLLGDWVEPDGDPYSQWTVRPSDFMLGHFRAFERATGNPAWAEVGAACETVITDLDSAWSAETGLMPDFAIARPSVAPAPPAFLEAESDGAYAYNAGRVPWRLGTDALLNHNPPAMALLRKLSKWIVGETNGDPEQIRAGYELDGEPLPGSDYFTSFFAAPLAVAAMMDPADQTWLDAVYASVRDRVEGYYEDSVTLLCMLVLSGTFWDPTQPTED